MLIARTRPIVPVWALIPVWAFIAVALVPPALAGFILWAAPIEGLTADRAALAARDYTLLWTAGRLALAHAFLTLTDPAAITAALRDLFGSGMPAQLWPYPPTALLIAAPLALLPFTTGLAIYTATTLAALAGALRLGRVPWPACIAVLCSPAVADNALAGQNGALTAALLTGGLLTIDRRPKLAGLLLGALVLKPQLALLLPLCLIAGARWTSLRWAAIAAFALVATSGLVFGLEPWSDYLRITPAHATAYLEKPWHGGPGQLVFASAFMAARALGAGVATAYAIQALTLLFSAVAAVRLWRDGAVDPTRRAAATLALCLLASPWVHTYDMPSLSVCLVLLWPSAPRAGRPALAWAWLWPGMLALAPVPNPVSFLTVGSIAWLSLGGRAVRARAPLALAVLACVLLPLNPAAAQTSPHACDAAAARAERAWNVPPGVLSAVGTVESGRAGGPHGRAPWPWTINAAGQGRYFETKEDAIAAVLAIMARGYPYIDVGCFQIDIAYHPGVFRSLDDAFDPERNAQAAAEILAAERRRAPDWATAVARYHSATPSLGQPYLERVKAALPGAKLRGVSAEFDQAGTIDLPYVVQLPTAASRAARRLPTIVYPASVIGRGPQIVQIDTPRPSPLLVLSDSSLPVPPP